MPLRSLSGQNGTVIVRSSVSRSSNRRSSPLLPKSKANCYSPFKFSQFFRSNCGWGCSGLGILFSIACSSLVAQRFRAHPRPLISALSIPPRTDCANTEKMQQSEDFTHEGKAYQLPAAWKRRACCCAAPPCPCGRSPSVCAFRTSIIFPPSSAARRGKPLRHTAGIPTEKFCKKTVGSS